MKSTVLSNMGYQTGACQDSILPSCGALEIRLMHCFDLIKKGLIIFLVMDLPEVGTY